MIPLAASIQRLAIVCPSWVGDTVMATPALRLLQHHLPATRITAICRPGLDQLLAGCPFINASIVCDNKGVFGPQRLAKAIKQSAADAVLLLPNSFRSAMGARLAGVPIRIGYDRDGRHHLLTHRLPPAAGSESAASKSLATPVPMVPYYLRLAAFALGVELDASLNQRVELSTTSDEEAAADELLRDVQPGFVALNPGANRSDKRWPTERFARLAERWPEKERSIVITGGPGEADLLDDLERQCARPLVNLAKRGVTLGSLKAVLRRAGVLITNDTGPRHIAAAMGTPVVTLFGPTDHRWTTLSGAREWLLLAEPFLPEELTADGHAKACDISKIAVQDALFAAQRLMNCGR